MGQNLGDWDMFAKKVLSSCNQLPQVSVKSNFCNSGDNIDRAYSEPISSAHKTLDCLLDLQDGLIENNSAISEALDTELTCVELFQPPCIRRCIGLLIVILKQGMERVRTTFYHQ